MEEQASSHADQFSVKTLLIISSLYVVAMSLLKEYGADWMPAVTAVVGGISGVAFFPRNPAKSGGAFGAVGASVGAIALHGPGLSLILAAAGMVAGTVIGLATRMLTIAMAGRDSKGSHVD